MRASSPAARRAFESGRRRHGEPGRDRASVFQPRPHRVGGEVIGGDAAGDALDAGSATDLGRERFGHPVVFDIPAERVEPDFRRVEFDRAGRKERSGVVDKAQGPERRGFGPQSRPKAEGVEKSDRAAEEGDGASASGPLPGAGLRRRRSGPRKCLRPPPARRAPPRRSARLRRARPALRRWSSLISRQAPRSGRRRGATLISRKLQGQADAG